MQIAFPLLAAALLLAGTACQKQASAPVAATNATSSGNPLTAPVDYLGAVGQAKKFSEKTINLAALQNAIQQFQAMEDRLPADLNELAAKHYIQAVPAAPSGFRLAYDPRTGDVKMLRSAPSGAASAPPGR